MTVILEVLNSETNLRRVQITRSAIIGRGRKCGLRIASSKVSRQHCELILKDGAVEVRDLGSSNGTFVNNKPLVPRVAFELDPDDELRLGSVRLRICFAAESANQEGDLESPVAEGDSSSGLPAAAAAVAAVAVGAAAGDRAPDFSDDDETAPASEAPVIADAVQDDSESVEDVEEIAVSEDVVADAKVSESVSDGAAASDGRTGPNNVLAVEPPDQARENGEASDSDDDSFTLFADDFEAPAAGSEGTENSEFDDSSILDFLGNLD